MQLSAKDAWKRILDEAKRELPEQAVDTWLTPADALSLDEERLVLGLPDEFAVKWNEAKHSAVLSRLAETVFGRRVQVVFKVPDDRLQRPQIDFFVGPPVSVEPTGIPAKVSSSPLPLNERYTFDTFVIGNNSNAASGEKFGTLTLNSGMSTVTTTTGTGTASTMSLTSASLVRNPGATVNFLATNQPVGALNALNAIASTLTFTTPPALTNGILPWAMVQQLGAATFDFATIGANGLTNFTNYKTTLAGALVGFVGPANQVGQSGPAGCWPGSRLG